MQHGYRLPLTDGQRISKQDVTVSLTVSTAANGRLILAFAFLGIYEMPHPYTWPPLQLGLHLHGIPDL